MSTTSTPGTGAAVAKMAAPKAQSPKVAKPAVSVSEWDAAVNSLFSADAALRVEKAAPLVNALALLAFQESVKDVKPEAAQKKRRSICGRFLLAAQREGAFRGFAPAQAGFSEAVQHAGTNGRLNAKNA